MVTTESSNVPWAPSQPYITKGMQTAEDLLNARSSFAAPNFDTYVPFSSQTQGALDNIWKTASAGNPLAGQSMSALGSIFGDQNNKYSQLYQQASNPYFEQAVQSQADKTAADVQRQFGALGRTGSAADTGALAQQVGDVRTQALSNQWNQNIANQQGILNDQSQSLINAVGAAPGAYQQQYLPAQYQQQVGASYDDLAQRKLQSQLDAFNTQQQQGWNLLGAYTGALSGTNATNAGFSSVQQPSNVLGSLLGGALGGASIGNSILPGGTGAGYGALAGGALSGLSSLFNF